MRMRILVICAIPAIGTALLAQAERAGEPRVAVQRFENHSGRAMVDVSADGRFIAFESMSRLSAEDTNSVADVYVLDRASRRLTLESVPRDGGASNGSSVGPRLSGDGRYVTFQTVATNLVPGTINPRDSQVILRDRPRGASVLVSGTPGGSPGDGRSSEPDISDDGRFVVFESFAANLVASGGNAPAGNVYLFDAATRTLDRVGVDSTQPRHNTAWPRISGDGRYIAFAALAAPATTVDVKAVRSAWKCDIYLRHVPSGATRLVSRTPLGLAGNGCSTHPVISGDGGIVGFTSTAGDLTLCDTNGASDVFLFDSTSDRVTLASRNQKGCGGNAGSRHPAISGDGRYVAFASEASDLMCVRRCTTQSQDWNLVSDVYLFDRIGDAMTRVSGAEEGAEPWWEASAGPAVDGLGNLVVFSSRHPVAPADLASDYDLFIRVLDGPRAAGTHHAMAGWR